ncbi:MAG: MBL fold metallo-hydrolase [Candidatus Dormibacteraeota bacterium]|nr:MBL fold metallo-hydrolase [Candidatus Dormibacteraeota bacterium]
MAEDRYSWAEPGLEEVADGVFRCPLPLPGDALRAVNSYIVKTDSGLLLVDCGWDRPECRRTLLEGIGLLGASLGDVLGIFATHVHRDHLGQAAWLRDRSGAWLTLGLGERATQMAFASDPSRARLASVERLRRCSAGDVADLLIEQAKHLPEDSWGPPRPDLYLCGQELLLAGSVELEVIATPGHTRGHLCLFDRGRGLLFAGDHVLPQITPSLGVELPGEDSPLSSFLSSLAAVRELPAGLVLPAHGPTFPNLRERVDELLAHHRRRLEGCLEVVRADGSTVREVAAALPWTRRGRLLKELDPFNQMLAVFETEAHLRVLADEGRLRTEAHPGGLRYFRGS